MPSSDYTSAVGGGLKLKGGGSGARVEKKKKKAKKSSKKGADAAADTPPDPSRDATVAEAATSTNIKDDEDDEEEAALGKALAAEDADALVEAGAQHEKGTLRHDGKTEAERRYEERRRKRLDERLRREGVQTHKERVERLNKYLSGLSEHHDMPRIGPG